ncbi:Cell cycle progression protein 1 [Triplophysa tibetana]|uniref:Cell cycle progression protein 1 n=1 Tax=Triplophysa tibetana TaxID=1572043 RepID=A0A5A9P3Y0_9TELE|nr:Cell cycle progression protein 1 [Triplophysa tibetana]
MSGSCYMQQLQVTGGNIEQLFHSPPVKSAAPAARGALRHCEQMQAIVNAPKAFKVKVQGKRAVCLEAGALTMVPVTGPQCEPTAFLLDPLGFDEEQLPEGLLVSPTLVPVRKGFLYAPVVNVGNTKVWLPPRHPIGTVQVVAAIVTGTDSILTENQRLKGRLQEERQKLKSFMNQRETLTAEAQKLRKELDEERKVTDKLKEELEELNQNDDVDESQTDAETEKLQTRLLELENKLKFEQQRSDLWERLYVESKEDRPKGDRDVKTKILKEGVMGKGRLPNNSVCPEL